MTMTGEAASKARLAISELYMRWSQVPDDRIQTAYDVVDFMIDVLDEPELCESIALSNLTPETTGHETKIFDLILRLVALRLELAVEDPLLGAAVVDDGLMAWYSKL